MDRHIGAQHAISSLCAAVEVEVRPMPHRIRAHRAILGAASTGILYLPAANGVPFVIGPNIATDLETDLSARDVVETLAVQRADPHVFDRPGLDGKIGGLRPRNRDKCCRGAEEKTFHLHSNLHRTTEGFGSAPGNA